MAIKTKSVYDPQDDGDGLRVLVTRYWPRGVRKDRADLWIRGLGPEPGLIKAWKGGSIGFDDFERSYRAEFSGGEKEDAMREIKRAISEVKGDVTLLCACRDESTCHRGILKGMLSAKGRRKS